jgi:hypothetical protein
MQPDDVIERYSAGQYYINRHDTVAVDEVTSQRRTSPTKRDITLRPRCDHIGNMIMASDKKAKNCFCPVFLSHGKSREHEVLIAQSAWYILVRTVYHEELVVIYFCRQHGIITSKGISGDANLIHSILFSLWIHWSSCLSASTAKQHACEVWKAEHEFNSYSELLCEPKRMESEDM